MRLRVGLVLIAKPYVQGQRNRLVLAPRQSWIDDKQGELLPELRSPETHRVCDNVRECSRLRGAVPAMGSATSF
jgi:hypothetical protein